MNACSIRTVALLRDNVYGSIEEDVWRRDFTVNALYYNIADFSLWDYVGGAEDLSAHRLRLIGDPETRYREDPVRMLRAARFEAKLGFTLEPATAEPMPRLRGLLAGVPAARLFDETLKLFLTGHGEASLVVLRRRALLEVLFPAIERYLAKHPGGLVEQLLQQGLRNTDVRVAADKPVTPTFLFALLLYGPIAEAIESLPPHRWHEIGAIVEACDRALREASARVTIPRRVALGLREMYAFQPRLEQPRGKRALRLLEQPRFRAAFDLLALRAQLGLAPAEIAAWWTRLQEVSPDERLRMLDACATRPGKSATAGRRRRAPAGQPTRRASDGPTGRRPRRGAGSRPDSARPTRAGAAAGAVFRARLECCGIRPTSASAAIWTSPRVRYAGHSRHWPIFHRRAWCGNPRCSGRHRWARPRSRTSSMRWRDCSRSSRRTGFSVRCARLRPLWAASRRACAGDRAASTWTCWCSAPSGSRALNSRCRIPG